jgi:GT2 family glycosyltransferase
MNEPLVYIAVLAWNHKEDTLECLASLRQMTYPNSKLLVVDNGSVDGTADVVRERFPGVEILRSETNLGVTGGYNLGIEYALNHRAEYVLVTNNDVIMDPEMLSEMVSAAENNKRVGVVLPKIYYYDRRNVIWCAGARWRPWPPEFKMTGREHRDGPQYGQMCDIDCAPSCCLLVERKAVEKAGMFDPKYFFYYDDWDFTERMRENGYRILFVPQAKMWHKVAASTQKSDKPARWWFVYGQSSVRFYLAHRTPMILFINNVWFLIREIIKLKFGRLFPYLAGVCNGLAQHRGWVPE